MKAGLIILFALCRIGLVDQVSAGVAHIEYVTNHNEIKYIDLPIRKTNCIVKEGTMVYFNDYIIVSCIEIK